ncbi:MAG: DMT family transporter [bacterium]|nr:DMT family transporter [bacterium]
MKKKRYAKPALFLTAIFWGTTFSIGKLATEAFSPSFIIALRFSVAAIALVIASYTLRNQVNKEYLTDGIWMGITLFLSYLLQVAGLSLDTSPGKSAFLCTTYCVLVPFLHWFVTKDRPKWLHILCVFICLAGIGILSLQGGWGMSMGDILTVLSGAPCAFNIVVSSIACRDKNPLLLTTIELSVVMVLAWICVVFTNTFPTEFPLNTVGGVVYLGLIATALCLYLQSYGLKYAEPSIGGMILSLESVFGVIFSIIIYHEKITLRMLIGFITVFIAVILSQYDDDKSIETKE